MAKNEYSDLFADETSSTSEYGDLFAEAPKSVPSVAKAPMSAPEMVATGVSQVPKMLYEAGAGTVNAFGQAFGMAQAPFDVAAGLVTGQGVQKSMEQGGRRIDQYKNWTPVPPTLGEPSWLNQIVGGGVNSLVQRGIISPESAESVGRLLAIAGAPKMLNSLRAPIAAGAEATANRYRAAFPPPDVRAGEMLYNTRKAVPVEVDSIAARAGNQELAKQVVGDQRFPEVASPNIRRQQLAANRATNSADVRATETATTEAVRTKADAGLGAAIPRENIDPARLDFVNRKIEAHNAAQTAAAEATTLGAKTAAQAGVESAARAALDEFESVVPKAGRLDPLPMGQRLLGRVRGEDGESGIRAVQKVFNEEYGKFDAKGAVASSADLQAALDASASTSAESGAVLRGFVDEAKKVESRLGGGDTPEMLTFAEEAAGAIPGKLVLPEELTLKQFRGLKGEFSTAAELARKANNRPAAMELDRLAGIARQGEDGAVGTLGPDMVKQYDAVRSAYKNVFVEAFRRGYGGKMTGFGSQTGGGGKIPAANVFPQLMNRQNAHDFTLALGAEEAAKSGKLLQGLTEADLLKMGQKGAQETVQPYVESTLATLYRNAGGGKKGVAAVERYLNTNANTIDAYGLNVSGLRAAATKYNEVLSRLTGAKSNAAKGVVEGVIPTTDPTKLGNYVLDSASPPSAYKNLLGVSKDPAWKSSVDTLMIDELKSRLDAGKDVFANPKTRAAVEAIWSPEQIKKLKAYHAVVRELSEAPARFKGEAPASTMHDAAMGALQAAPPGFSWRYFIKGGVKLLAKLGIKAGDDAMYSFLDDALMNPATADTIVAAYKGSALAKRQLAAAVEKESQTWKALAWKTVKGGAKQVPPALPGAVGGAVSKGANPNFSSMSDDELLSFQPVAP